MVVQLHNHSHFSVLDGRSRISEIIDRVKDLGQTAIALTDHGVMYGSMEFYRAAIASNVKPIIGVEAYMSRGPMSRRDPHLDKQGSSYHITLLATNSVGYKNLLKITSKAHVEGFYYKPRIDFSCLEQYSEGIFALSGCMSSQISESILEQRLDDARKIGGKCKDIFGDRYAIEIHNHGHEKQLELNPQLIKLAKSLGLKTVAACDSHYARPEDAQSHDALLAIQTGSTIDSPTRFKITPYGAYYIKSHEEMMRDFSGNEESVINTEWVSEQCNLSLDFSKIMLPDFAVPDNHTPSSWLRQQVLDGLRWRYGTVSPTHQERANYELDIIDKTGYALYFLIVQDYVRFARMQGVMAVPRGSVAGSLCVYALGICDIDPIKYNIMFERFLHEERKGMPDIDMDFADDRRDDIIEYVTNKYGKNKVAHIGTFQTLGARAAVKDIARVMNVDFYTSNAFTALFPDKPDTSLAQVAQDARIIQAISDNPVLGKVFELAKDVEGLTRGFGTHAAGMLITATDLDEVVPVQMPPEKSSKKIHGTFVTQYDNNNTSSIIESIGLSKFDFLGLSNLTIIKNVCQLIKLRHGIDLYGQSGEKLYTDLPIDYEDEQARRAYDMLASGNTSTLFQVESEGMRRVLRLVQPNRITDLPAIVALYRPGPMEYIPVFADAKHGRVEISYLHDDLRPILEETYGVVTYQDQVLLIAKTIAGFSWGEVDALRKGMGKKLSHVIEEQKNKFLSKSIARGYDKDVVSEIWKQIAPFAGYGFNRAHAFCYGYISYITAFIKANYTIEYLTTVLTQESGNKDKVSEAISEAKKFGIEVLPPSVNISAKSFSIVSLDNKDVIAFGLTAVAGMGENACKSIIAARTNLGRFTSFGEFLSRINLDSINQRAIGNLIKAGAFDEFGDRAALLAIMPEMMDPARKISSLRSAGQMDLFSRDELQEFSTVTLPAFSMTRKQRLDGEFEVLGVYLSEHPLDDVRSQLDYFCTHTSETLLESENQPCVVGGLIVRVKNHYQKNGKPMAFVTLQDYGDPIDVLVFSHTYERLSWSLKEDLRVLVRGSIRAKDGKCSVMAEDIVVLNPNAPSPDLDETASKYAWNIVTVSAASRISKLWNLHKYQSKRENLALDRTLVTVQSSAGDITFETRLDISAVESLLG